MPLYLVLIFEIAQTRKPQSFYCRMLVFRMMTRQNFFELFVYAQNKILMTAGLMIRSVTYCALFASTFQLNKVEY
jgi:hypothetical protein